MYFCWVHLSWRRYLFHAAGHAILPAQNGIWDLYMQAPNVIWTHWYVVIKLPVCVFWYFVSLVTAVYIRLFYSFCHYFHIWVYEVCVLLLSSVETVRICILYRWEQFVIYLETRFKSICWKLFMFPYPVDWVVRIL